MQQRDHLSDQQTSQSKSAESGRSTPSSSTPRASAATATPTQSCTQGTGGMRSTESVSLVVVLQSG